MQPAIKWSGSKRPMSKDIISHFPKEINTYYEPFCGGCSILMALMESDIKVKNYICSDLNGDLISLWNEIKNNPNRVIEEYSNMWHEMNSSQDKAIKRSYFEEVRNRFNKEKSPYDFMFIMRTTTNGMPRYNKKGEFNNSFHITRDGIMPDKLKFIILKWSELLSKNNVIFLTQSYESINSADGDVLFCDPPYANTKGMYFGALDNDKLWDWLRTQNGKYLLTFDGISGNADNTFSVPKDIYSEHKYLLSGNSSFKRTIGKSNDSIVYESLYIK